MTTENPEAEQLAQKLKLILERVNQLPNLDERSSDEILGYDEHGVPK